MEGIVPAMVPRRAQSLMRMKITTGSDTCTPQHMHMVRVEYARM
jgi:hypothetical protein